MEQILHIDALMYGSAGVGRLESGKAVFVDHSAPGDLVRVEITKEKKNFAEAKLLEVIEPGPARVAPACPHAGVCGGCPWGHISYQHQLEAKRENTIAALCRIGGWSGEDARKIVEPCVGSKRQMGYRNKLELACSTDEAGRLTLGFMQEGSHRLITPQSCPLAHKSIQAAPKKLAGALRFLQGAGTANGGLDLGLFRVGVRTSVRTKSTEIALWTKPGHFPRQAAVKVLSSALKATSIVHVIADPGKERKVKRVERLHGKGFWEEDLCGIRYMVSAPSFFQVNTAQAETLVRTAIEGLGLDECSRVADLYCGVGTFTLPMEQIAGEVIGVECAASSVRDLRRNADNNDAWVDVIGDDSARALPELGHLDALVVDPPRTGLADGVAQDIANAAPERVAYISCNPTTWARDVARLEACGYALAKVVPVDLFPQTYHNELVSIFERM